MSRVSPTPMSVTHPELASELHPIKNDRLKFFGKPIEARELPAGTGKKLWWKCSICEHNWEATGDKRKRGQGCPVCTRNDVHSDGRNSMKVTNPDISKEFHPKKNIPFTTKNLVAGTNRKLWWRCGTCENEWEASGSTRLRGHGCPSCSGHSVHSDGRNSMAVTHPEIAEELHPTENGNMTAKSLKAGTNKKLWWICKSISENPCGHVWKTSGSERLRHGCPKCGYIRMGRTQRTPEPGESLDDLFPELSAEWHDERNGSNSPADYNPGTDQKAWWKCQVAEDHEWEAAIVSRTAMKSGCPFCAGKKASVSNSIKTLLPEIVDEWHPTRNGPMTPSDVASGSSKKYWWKCLECENEWKASPANRKQGTGCPPCGVLKRAETRSIPKIGNSVSEVSPAISLEWHPSRNTKRPEEVSAQSNKKFWWKCEDGHEWEAPPSARVSKGSGCPYCANQLVSETNNMGVQFPETLDIWHPSLNKGTTPFDVLPSTGKRYWWLCPVADDHVFQRSGNAVLRAIKSDTEGRIGCPMCRGRVVVKSNCIETTHNSDLLEEWDEELTGFSPRDVVIGTNKRVWWRCKLDENHIWSNLPHSRLVQGRGCPACAKSGFDTSRPGQLYLHRILKGDQVVWYKLGISNDWENRLLQLKSSLRNHSRTKDYRYEMVEVIQFESGIEASTLESSIKRKFKTIRAPKIKHLSGGNELFLVNPIEEARNLGMMD